MRKTSDLVNEMLKEAKGAWLVAIVVGFENETQFVFSSQKQPLGELNRLVQKGGSPIGLLRFDKEGTADTGIIPPLRGIRKRGMGKKIPYRPSGQYGRDYRPEPAVQSFPTAY